MNEIPKNEINLKQEVEQLKKRIEDIIEKNKKKKKDEIYFEKYKLLFNYVLYQDRIYYFIFSVFIAINGLLLSDFPSQSNIFRLLGLSGIPVFGLVLSIFWLIISERSLAWRDTTIFKANRILNKIEKGNLKVEKIKKRKWWLPWKDEYKTYRISLEPWKDTDLFYKGLLGDFSAVRASILFIYLMIAIWIYVNIRDLIFPQESFPIYSLEFYLIWCLFLFIISIFITIFCLDMFIRYTYCSPLNYDKNKKEMKYEKKLQKFYLFWLIIFLIITIILLIVLGIFIGCYMHPE